MNRYIFYLFFPLLFFTESLNCQLNLQIIELSSYNNPESFAKLKLKNTYAFLFFLNQDEYFNEQLAIIDSLALYNSQIADYIIIKYSSTKKENFFKNKVRSNHYQLYSANPEFLYSYREFGSLMTGSSSFLKLYEENCMSDKYLTQLKEFFIPIHQEVIELIYKNHANIELLKSQKTILSQNLALKSSVEEIRKQINTDKRDSVNTLRFFIQIGGSFGFSKKYSILNDNGPSHINSSKSSSINLKFSVSPSQPVFIINSRSNYLNIGLQYSDNQQQLSGKLHQRAQEAIAPSDDLFLDIKSNNIRESVRTKVLSVPILIRTELKRNKKVSIGTLGGIQLNRVFGSSYQVVSGSYDSRAYISSINEIIENIPDLDLRNGSKLSNKSGILSLKHTSINPSVGLYIERIFDVNRSFHTEIILNPFYKFQIFNSDEGMIAANASSYNGLFNGVKQLHMPTFSVMLGFSI